MFIVSVVVVLYSTMVRSWQEERLQRKLLFCLYKSRIITNEKNTEESKFLAEDTIETPSTCISSNGATLKVNYEEHLIGICTMIERLVENTTVVNLGGCGKVKIVDALSFQNIQKSSEERRKSHIRELRDRFMFAATFSLPLSIISMMLVYIPGFKSFFKHHHVFWNITWEEYLTWLLAPPVQFISRARFYKEAYFSIRSKHLGMSFLIEMGTSAAYFYLVFVVVYNAATNEGLRDSPQAYSKN